MLREDIEMALSALSDQLDRLTPDPIELLVCGGSALNILGFIRRSTKDVDVLAYVKRDDKGNIFLVKAHPITPELLEAAGKVARDYNLPEGWLNAGPASAVDLGLPEGIMERVTARPYGRKLIVHFMGRLDQIHFKLYAAVDQGAGKHYDDLLALEPTGEELEKGSRWAMTHDVSEGFKQSLKNLLTHMGFENVANRI
jgi:1,6-anhydro-N-acetylmuramate kinase